MHLLLYVFISFMSIASAERFTADNTAGKVQFKLNSTLHEVPGDATSFTSELLLEEDENEKSVTGKLVVQVESIKTGIGMRDNRMYEHCLDSKTYPTIVFKVRAISGDAEKFYAKEGEGTIKLHGQLTVRSTTRDMIIPSTFNWAEGTLKLTGNTQFKWTDFGVSDPSTFFSKVEPEMKLNFNLGMKKAL